MVAKTTPRTRSVRTDGRSPKTTCCSDHQEQYLNVWASVTWRSARSRFQLRPTAPDGPSFDSIERSALRGLQILSRFAPQDKLSVGITFFRSAARGLHIPAKLIPEATKHEARKRRANERPRVGCCEELGRFFASLPELLEPTA